MRQQLKLLIVLITTTVLIMGCATPQITSVNPTLGELSYKTIKIPSPEFDNLAQGDWADWYENYYAVKGIHSFTKDEHRYLLLSAGEKPTGGYSLEQLILVGTEKEIEVKAQLRLPEKDQYVTESLTYPHLLVVIPEDGRQLIFGGIEEIPIKENTNENNSKNEEVTQTQKDSGRYTGQIDNNSIEIKISGVPENIAPRAFQLGEQVKNNFQNYDLKTGDEIIFTYIPRENAQPVIIELEKL